MVVKAALFTGFLHINAARKVAATHLMWQLQPLLGHLSIPSLPRVCRTCPCYECSLGWVILIDRVHVEPYSSRPRRHFSSNFPLNDFRLTRTGLGPFLASTSSPQTWLTIPYGAQGLLYDFGHLGLCPYNNNFKT